MLGRVSLLLLIIIFRGVMALAGLLRTLGSRTLLSHIVEHESFERCLLSVCLDHNLRLRVHLDEGRLIIHGHDRDIDDVNGVLENAELASHALEEL